MALRPALLAGKLVRVLLGPVALSTTTSATTMSRLQSMLQFSRGPSPVEYYPEYAANDAAANAALVKNAFSSAYNDYKAHAYGHDDLAPVSGGYV